MNTRILLHRNKQRMGGNPEQEATTNSRLEGPKPRTQKLLNSGGSPVAGAGTSEGGTVRWEAAVTKGTLLLP